MENKNLDPSPYNTDHSIPNQQNQLPSPTPDQSPVIPPFNQTNNQQMPTNNPHASHPKRLLLIVAIVASVTLVAAGTAIFLLTQKKPVPRQPAKAPEDVTITPLTAVEAIKNLRTYYKGTQIATSAPSTPIMAKDQTFYTVITDATLVAKTSIAEVLSPENAKTNLEAIRKSLQYDQFSETIVAEAADGATFLADYNRKDVVCQTILENIAGDASARQHLEVKCLDMKVYEDLANAQEPFFNAYRSASASSASPAFIGPAAISPSATAGYQLAEIQTANAIDAHHVTAGPRARFYAGPDKVWKFFTDASGVLACSLYYKVPDITNAYLDKPCLDSKNQQMTVKLKRK